MIRKILVLLLFPFLVSAQSAFISGNDTICDNGSVDAQVEIEFKNVVPPITFIYAIDSISQPEIILPAIINPYIIHTQEPGVYTLQWYEDANDNTGSISGSALVTVLESPVANFHPNPDTMTILYTTPKMIDESEGNIITWQWDFGDNSFDSLASPYHTYPDSIAVYQVSLVIIDSEGCSDTTFKHVQITDDHWIYIPNSFTPDLDGKNDKFCISYYGVREETFIFNLYSGLSELVYSTNNINDLRCIYDGGHLINGWDGRYRKIQKDLPSDTYAYEIYFQDFEGWKHTEYGTILLVR